MASGEMSEDEFSGFLTRGSSTPGTSRRTGPSMFVCMDWRHMGELQAAGHAAQLQQKNLCVWAKDNGGMGTFYRSQHELVFVFKHGQKPAHQQFRPGRGGPLPHQPLELPGGEHAAARAAWTSLACIRR